jgi:hypothetical protein
LFQHSLNVKNASTDTIVWEILELDAYSLGVAGMKEILFAFNRLLMESNIPEDKLNALSKKAFIPVRGGTTLFATPSLSESDVFWLADRPLLLDAFEGRIPLMDLSINELDKLPRFINAFKLRERLLSRTVEEERIFVGNPVLDCKYTHGLRAKAPFILE